MSKTLLEVDKLINIPAMKTHDHPGVTLIHKNYVGTYMQRAYGARNNSKMGLHTYIAGIGNIQVTAGFVGCRSGRMCVWRSTTCAAPEFAPWSTGS